MMFPIGLNGYFWITINWRPTYLLCLLGSIWGWYGFIWLTSTVAGLRDSSTSDPSAHTRFIRPSKTHICGGMMLPG